MRYFIEIAYNGKNYHGWQIQPDAISIQEVLEDALSTILRKETKVVGAGRTDTGVHAKQLFAHFDATLSEDVNSMQFRLNSFLPNDISIGEIFSVRDDAHARFHAVEREYEYCINLSKSPFSLDFTHYIHKPLDVERMNEASKLLLGHQDFQCFSRTKTNVKTYYCDIKKAKWEQNGNLLVFTIRADRFLRNMVRAIVGTLLEVGHEKISQEDFKRIIESKNRSNAKTSAPAHGLYLTKVLYPADIRI